MFERSDAFWLYCSAFRTKGAMSMLTKSHFILIILTQLLVGMGALAVRGEVPDHAVILMYHHVDESTPQITSVTPDLFEEHLTYLERHGFRIWPLPAVVDSLKSGGAIPDSVVAITFDDGYRSVFTEAFPRLRKRGWPFTVFVSTEDIDQHNGPVLHWDQLREMAMEGATIASHGHRHRHLQRLEPGESRQQWRTRTLEELRRSRQRILEEIGQDPELLAYPYGEFDEHVQELVRQLDWTAFGQQSGAAGPLKDGTCLPRYPLAADFALMADFPVKAASLPLPVLQTETEDLVLKYRDGSVIVGAEAPVLMLTLGPGDYQADQLSAYASGQGRAHLRWLDRVSGKLEIQAPYDIPAGRSRYNLTAPAAEPGRWYWFSYTWIVGALHQD